MPSGSKAKKDTDKPKSDKYEDIYFDSDEEEGDQRKVVSNDDLFYDPGQDAADQTWVDEVRQSYQMSRPGDSVKKLPNSDAVLNCPACFSGMNSIAKLRCCHTLISHTLCQEYVIECNMHPLHPIIS